MLLRDDDPSLSDRQRRMVEEAEKSCARIIGLIGELSELSNLDSGTVSDGTDRFDLFALVAELAAGVQESRDREVAVEVRGENAGAFVRGDLGRLRSAFAAFFKAILREQPSASRVVVDRKISGGGGFTSAVVVISEERSVQAAYDAPPGSFEEKRGGMGLALPIARRVVERHGGRVWSPIIGARDTAKPRTAIVVSLPISEPLS